jgi:hypothetical protein
MSIWLSDEEVTELMAAKEQIDTLKAKLNIAEEALCYIQNNELDDAGMEATVALQNMAAVTQEGKI